MSEQTGSDADRGLHSALTRRALLQATGAAGVLAVVPGAASAVPQPYSPPLNHEQPMVPGIPFFTYRSPPLTRFVDELPRLPRIESPRRLVAAGALHRFHRDLDPAPSVGFGGLPHHGPTIETRAGEQPQITFVNQMRTHPMAIDVDPSLHGVSELDRHRPPLVLHLHGAPNHPAQDGFPRSPFRLGRSVTYPFTNPPHAAPLWYHDHSMGTTRLSIYAGLTGHYHVRDEWDTGEPGNPLGLPAGEYETALIMCDKLFYPNGHLRYDNTPTVAPGHWSGGMCGDTMVLNGKAWPRMSVDRGLYRFRVLSASQLNDYRLALSDGSPFWVIDKVRYLAENPPPLFGTRWTPDPDRYRTSPMFAPAPYEFGWKDTVRCPPNQVTRIVVRWPRADEIGFDPDVVFTGLNGEKLQGYVWHCHLTDHEDNEMMQRIRVVRPGAGHGPEVPAPGSHDHDHH